MKIKEVSEVYCIAQEDFGTPSRHVHIFFTHTHDEKHHYENKFLLHKKAKELWETLKDLQTNVIYTGKMRFVGSSKGGTSYGLDSQWDIEKGENPDPKYYIGYCCKNNDTLTDIKGFDQEYISKSVKYYSACEGTKLLNTSKNIWRILKSNNAHSYITDFCKKNEIIIDDDLDENLLQKMMASQGISVVELSHNKYDHIIRDLIEYHKGTPLCSTITQLKGEISLLKEMYHTLEKELDELDPKSSPLGHPWSRNRFNL